MKGLRTARVAVIDDIEEEAMPIIRILGRNGIGAVYFSGENERELPSEPLSGLRLVFLDMDLGVGPPVKQVVGKTINVLKRILAPESTPVVIVVWTRHSDYVGPFREAYQIAFPQQSPGIIAELPKPTGVSHWATQRLTRKVEKHLQGKSPLDLLWYWEQAVHDATSQSTASFSKLVHENGATCGAGTSVSAKPLDEWCGGMTNVLGAIINAIAGATISDGESALRAMFAGMNPISFDRIEHARHEDRSVLRSAKAIADQADAERERNKRNRRRNDSSFLSAAKRGRVNKMLLLAPVASPRRLWHEPGNIYMEELWDETASLPFPIGGSKLRKTQIVKDVAQLPDPKGKKVSKRDSYSKERQKILRKSRAFLLELTPPCDLAQQKAKMARCVAGVILPEYAKPRKAEYLKLLGPFQFDRDDGFGVVGPFNLVLDARYVFGFCLSDIERQRPVGRLRSEPLQDAIVWFAGHASRLGHVSLR
jgi:hypothetical protein